METHTHMLLNLLCSCCFKKFHFGVSLIDTFTRSSVKEGHCIRSLPFNTLGIEKGISHCLNSINYLSSKYAIHSYQKKELSLSLSLSLPPSLPLSHHSFLGEASGHIVRTLKQLYGDQRVPAGEKLRTSAKTQHQCDGHE